MAAAADKLRREKWRAEETQRIKEATVKSLEPEIQRIIAKGKTEIQKLKALHEVEDTLHNSMEFSCANSVLTVTYLITHKNGQLEEECGTP